MRRLARAEGRLRAVALLLIALGLSVLAAGCGDSGKTESSSVEQSQDVTRIATTGLDKATYARKATVICARAGQEIVASVASQAGQSEAEIFEGLRDAALVPAVERELKELGQLGAPSGDRAKVEAILNALQQGVASLRGSKITSLEDFGKSFVPYDRLVRGYGVGSCAFGFA